MLRTRVFNQPKTDRLYNNGLDALVKVLKKEGPLALYKGTLLFLVTFEFVFFLCFKNEIIFVCVCVVRISDVFHAIGPPFCIDVRVLGTNETNGSKTHPQPTREKTY
jgi:hypothetical protein